jgi:chromosome segregation ATPase
MTPGHGKILRWSLIGVAVLVLAGASALLVWRVRSYSAQVAALARLEAENRALRAKSTQSANDLAELRRQLGLPVPASSGQDQYAQRRRLSEAAEARLEAVRLVGQLRDSLAAANSTIANLQGRIQELEAGTEKLTTDNRRLSAAENEVKERLAGTNRIVEAMQAELKGRSDRTTQLDIATRALRAENKTLGDRNRQLAQWHRELEDIDRRREMSLNTLLRRCREAADQFRMLTAKAAGSRDALANSGVDLDRLQNVVATAEDELRQLSGLNAQAQRLAHKMRER